MPTQVSSKVTVGWFIILSLLAVRVVSGQTPSSYPKDTSYVSSLLRKGELLENQNAEAALTYYRRAYGLSQKIRFTKGYFESMRLLTFTLNNIGRYDEARRIAQTALRMARQDTSKRNIGLSHFALAVTAWISGDWQEAVHQYHRAAHYMRLINHVHNQSVIYNNLATIYEQQHMYKQALAYYNKALAINRRNPDDPRSIAIDYFGIANIYSRIDSLDLAKAYYQKAWRLVDPRDRDFLINLHNNIGHLYEDQGQYDSTLYHYRLGLDLSRQLKNPRHELHMLMATAQVQIRQSRYVPARSLLDAAYAIARRENAGLPELRNIYRNYALLHEGLGNYKAALNWYDQYITARDSLESVETKELLQSYEEKIRRAEAQQKLTQKQREIERLESDRNRQVLWLWLAGISVAAVVALAVIGWLYFRQRQRAKDNALVAMQREQELVAIQAELHGQQKERLRISKEMHDDLGASLTAIGLLSEVLKTRMGAGTAPEVMKISDISADMVTTMNEIIWSLNTKNDSLNGLIAYIRSYAGEFIENTTLTVKIQAGEAPADVSVRGADRRNVFLTVKEALNNVVKHAQATQVTLRIDPRDTELVIDVSDNGRGFEPQEKHKLRNGLTNMNNRMSESGGSFTITSSPAGTSVTITYPYGTGGTAKNTTNEVWPKPEISASIAV